MLAPAAQTMRGPRPRRAAPSLPHKGHGPRAQAPPCAPLRAPRPRLPFGPAARRTSLEPRRLLPVILGAVCAGARGLGGRKASMAAAAMCLGWRRPGPGLVGGAGRRAGPGGGRPHGRHICHGSFSGNLRWPCFGPGACAALRFPLHLLHRGLPGCWRSRSKPRRHGGIIHFQRPITGAEPGTMAFSSLKAKSSLAACQQQASLQLAVPSVRPGASRTVRSCFASAASLRAACGQPAVGVRSRWALGATDQAPGPEGRDRALLSCRGMRFRIGKGVGGPNLAPAPTGARRQNWRRAAICAARRAHGGRASLHCARPLPRACCVCPPPHPPRAPGPIAPPRAPQARRRRPPRRLARQPRDRLRQRRQV
jgi:hypothetical protein